MLGLTSTSRNQKHHYAWAVPRFDDPETVFVRALVAEGEQVLDLGANVGWYTYLLSQRVGPAGRVLSVEPFPETHRLLAGLVARLDLRNVTVIQRAVSDRPGTVVMEVPLFETGGENFYQARIVPLQTPSERRRHCEVEGTTVDELASHLRVAFIKGDVEGHELQLLHGSTDTIRRWQPSWLLEVSGDPDQAGTAASEVFEILLSCGYEPYLICDGRLRRRTMGDRSDNYFFLARQHLQRMSELGAPVEPRTP
jgi:FkbM family methyltransferase